MKSGSKKRIKQKGRMVEPEPFFPIPKFIAIQLSMVPDKERDKRTRDRIIAASKRRFMEQGIQRTKIEEIVYDLGMSKRTFYRFFKNKTDLLEAVVAEIFSMLFPKLFSIFSNDEQATVKLKRYHNFLVEELFRQVSLEFIADLEVEAPFLWKEIYQTRMILLQKMRSVIEEGQKSGQLRTDVDAGVVTGLIISIINQVGTPRGLVSLGLQPSILADYLFKMFFEGLLRRDNMEERL